MINSVVKVTLLWGLYLLSVSAFAQTPEVKKTTDIVVIRGKSYYLHVVEEKQTLFSICKAYGVNIEEVKEANDKHDYSIRVFDVLKIPYVETPVKQEDGYYYHTVEKGETLYSISRRFGIKAKLILKENERYVNGTLSVGNVVRWPLKEMQPNTDPAQSDLVEKSKKTEFAEKSDTLTGRAEEIAKQDTLNLATIFATPLKEEKPEFVSILSMSENKQVKVALLLPLYASENMRMNGRLLNLEDTLPAERFERQILPKSEQFVYFYEGFLLAVDSLKKDGYKIDLYVYDTEKSSEKMYQITAAVNALAPDLIIGPVYGSEYRVIAENLLNKNIPLVYPLSSRNEDLNHYPNLLQVNPSFQVLAGEMARWIASQCGRANIISMSWSGHEENDEQALSEMTEKNLFTKNLQQIPLINYYKWNFQEEQVEAFKLILKKEQENIIILPSSKEADVSKMLPVLSAFSDEYRITVLGFPEWQNFTSVDHETFYKLNVKLFAYSYIDNLSENGKRFADTYRNYFYSEPHSLVNKAYDMGLYFIPLAAKFGDKLLESISFCEHDGMFSRFRFYRMNTDSGRENYGLYIVNYGSDYSLKIEPLRHSFD